MPSTSDEMLSLNTLKQEGLIVIFTSNTCPFVVGFNDGTFGGWENSYNSIYEKASANSISVVLVNSNEAKREGGESMVDMTKRKSEKGFMMPYVLDKNSELANAFGAKTTPHVFFFDRNLKLIYTGSIDNSFEDKRKSDVPYLINAIDSYSKGKKIKVKSSSPKGCSIKRTKN
jgi:thioredoxin-related protein